MKKLICANCGSMRGFKKQMRGHFLITFILLMFFFIPGVIYGLWRMCGKTKVCKQCGSKNLIPIDTPVGQKLFTEYYE